MNKQTGEGEIGCLLISAGLVYLAWIAISFIWHFVSTSPSTEKLSAQQSFAKSIGVPFPQYIANTCKLEKICLRYNIVRRECATAGSIKKCIKIKMGNSDYSACEGGNFFEHAPGTVGVLPTYNQCIFNKINGLFGINRDDADKNQLNHKPPPPTSKILPPNAASNPATGDEWYWWQCSELKKPIIASIAPYPDCFKTTAPSNKTTPIPNSTTLFPSTAAPKQAKPAKLSATEPASIASLPPPPAWMIGTANTPSPTQASGPWIKYAQPAASFGVQPKASFDPSTARLLQSASGTARSRSPSPSATNSPRKPPASDAGNTPSPPHQALALDEYARALSLYSGLRHDAENGNAGAFGALSQAANDGDSTAQLELGRLYDNRKNLLRANYWYRKSANQGDGNAQDALGYAYQFGRGVSRNDVTADQWYLKAAIQGDPNAQIALGVNYLMGRGVSVDPVESYKWFYLAARNVNSSTDELTLARTELRVSALTPAQLALAESKAVQWLKAYHTR